jgi:hypothetical protein
MANFFSLFDQRLVEPLFLMIRRVDVFLQQNPRRSNLQLLASKVPG